MKKTAFIVFILLSSCKEVMLYPYQSQENDKWGFINKDSVFVIAPKFELAYNFKEGLASVAVNGNEKWGYINKKGEFIVPPTFDVADDFKNGLARVSLANKWGYINKIGKLVIPAQYTMACDFQESGLALAYVGAKEGYINSGGKWRFINRKGETVPTLQFDAINTGFGSCFKNGLVSVQVNNLWGYIDIYGNRIVKPTYTKAAPFLSRDGKSRNQQENRFYESKRKTYHSNTIYMGK